MRKGRRSYGQNGQLVQSGGAGSLWPSFSGIRSFSRTRKVRKFIKSKHETQHVMHKA
jgi:hypothetical protein